MKKNAEKFNSIKRIQIEYFLKKNHSKKTNDSPWGIGGEKKNKGTNNPNH